MNPDFSITNDTRPICTYLIALLLFFTAGCRATSTIQDEGVSGTLKISEDGRWLTHNNEEPFFYLGDTAWELFHRLNREEADMYLEDRAEKGFTVIQAVVLAELDGLDTPNPYGHTPLIDHNPSDPDEAYFDHVDYIVNRANELGMFIGMLPTWGDKFNRQWGVGPEVFTPDNAESYGRYLADRYRNNKIIWILGGDRNPEDDEDIRITRRMAEGIRSSVGDSQLITYHPQGSSKSYQWFHHDGWLDFNIFQSSHGRFDMPNYQFTLEGYNQNPVKPVLDAEPRYEDHPVNWNPDEGWFSDFDVRQAAWWSMLSGAAGHTYGDHNIWQMWQPGRSPVSSARTPWYEALQHPGSAQMGYMRDFFESIPYQELVPDQSLINGNTGDGARHIRASSTPDGHFMVAYIPYGQSFNTDLTKSGRSSVHASWFNPRDNTTVDIGSIQVSDNHPFDPPGSEERGNDWVLLIERSNR